MLPALSKCIIIAIQNSYNKFEGVNPIHEPHNDAKKLLKLIKEENKLVDEDIYYYDKDIAINSKNLYSNIVESLENALNNISNIGNA